MMKEIDTVIFDVGGVLADFNPVSYFLQLGYSKEKASLLSKATVFDPDWKEFDRGVLTDEEIRNRFKRKAPELADDIDKSLAGMHGLVTRKATSIPWIESVKRRGIRTYILSNFSYTVMKDNMDALDFQKHVDGCFWSMEHKVIKPDNAAFLTLFYEFNIDPVRAVFIDDTEDNIKAAEKFGVHGILYKNQRQAESQLNDLISYSAEDR